MEGKEAGRMEHVSVKKVGKVGKVGLHLPVVTDDFSKQRTNHFDAPA